jgi:hypothetical protein
MRKALLLVLLVALCCPTACTVESEGTTEENITVRVVATLDFGDEVLVDNTISVAPGTCAMDAVRQVADVGTKYGGGFVQSVNGIESGKPAELDWFFFLNGFMSNKGAANCRVRDGDLIQLDFHDWRFRTFIPATIGAFPETLLYGFEADERPTAIAYEPGLADCAERLAEALEQMGVEVTFVGECSGLAEPEKGSSNLVIIGTTNCAMISELNEEWERMGFFVHFQNGAMTVHDATGEMAAEYGAGSGVIQATQNPWNPKGTGVCENVAVMLAGTDEAGVRGAAGVLADNPDLLRLAFAAVVIDGAIIRVPEE